MVREYVSTKRRQVTIATTYGYLKVLKFAGRNQHGNLTWFCECRCRNKLTVTGPNLLNGTNPSCGCYKTEILIERNFRHGKSKTLEYKTWLGIRARCNDLNNSDWKSYGGRGITVCGRWKSFDKFYEDMGDRPTRLHTLERLDNNAGYSPGNCEWATRKVQGRNKRNVPLFEYNGSKKSVAEWAEIYSIHPETLRKRIRNGWSMEKSLTASPRPIRGVHY